MDTVTDIVRDNISFAEEKISLWQKLRGYQFVEALMKNKPEITPSGIGAYYRELLNLTDTPENLCTVDFADFCKRIVELFGEEMSQRNDDGDEIFREDKKTAYLQNGFSDKAYGIFSEEIRGMTAEYQPGFAEACEAVYDNQCKYVILPLYTSADGRLMSFQKLVSKYDLKICNMAEVLLPDERTMHFALLQKGIAIPETYEFADITLVLSENVSIGKFLSACEALGAVALTIDSMPLTYADETQEFCIHFYTNHTDIRALLIFLDASHVRYTLGGVYSLIRT